MVAVVKYLLIVSVVVLLLCAVSYVGIPVYRFGHGRAFRGDRIYDPYSDVDPEQWRKANFHAHQSEKPKCDYSAEQMLEAYRLNGYDIIGISDHQKLNLAGSDRPGFIPIYEHGYGLNRCHHLLIGAQKVSWRDCPVMLTRSQVQFMLAGLRPQAELVVLNHPGQMRWIDHRLYGCLRGYDLMEINPETGPERSDIVWDAALSAGIYSTLVANDDAHSITDRESWFQRCFTMLNTPSLDRGDILASLRKGTAYGVYVPAEVNLREKPHADLPRVERIGLQGDTISLRLDRPARSIRFIGQEGHVLARTADSRTGHYRFDERDTYARAVAEFDDGVVLYFNPFVRTSDGLRPGNAFVPEIDYPLTILSDSLWLTVVAVLGRLLFALCGVRHVRPYPVRVPFVVPDRPF